jgi:RimJ/RimL family protein N-acetyltransferase
VKEYALNKLQLPELISIIQPGNTASIRIAEKLSMKPYKRVLFNQDPVVIYRYKNDKPHK